MSRSTSEWVQHYLYEDLSKEEMLELAQLLDSDEEFRKKFVRYVTFDAAIGSALFSSSEGASPIPLAKLHSRRRPLRFATGMVASIAALLLVGWFLVQNWTPAPSTVRAVAILDSTEGAVWAEEFPNEEGWLFPGRYILEMGSATFTFDSGARTTVIGPAVFELVSPKEMNLDEGGAGFYVEEQAKGFKVNTPSGTIVDLGTAFTVDVDGDAAGIADVHVLEGEVEVSTRTQKRPTVLREQEATQIDATGKLSKVTFKADEGRTPRIRRARNIQHFIHFPMDSPVESKRFIEHRGYNGIDTIERDLRSAYQSSEVPELVAGKFKRAMKFDGTGAPTISVTSVSERARYTVSLWARIPAGAALHESTIVEFRNESGLNEQLTVSWNADENLGEYGALRIDYQSGFVIGSSPINDGEWHHIAVNVVNGPGTRVATHLRQYVDGRLDEVSALRDASMMPTNPAEGPVLFTGFEFDSTKPFRGSIDELMLMGPTLRPDQIYALYSSNNLPYKLNQE